MDLMINCVKCVAVLLTLHIKNDIVPSFVIPVFTLLATYFT